MRTIPELELQIAGLVLRLDQHEREIAELRGRMVWLQTEDRRVVEEGLPAGLGRREVVAELRARGWTVRRIAGAMGCAERSVARYLKGASNR